MKQNHFVQIQSGEHFTAYITISGLYLTGYLKEENRPPLWSKNRQYEINEKISQISSNLSNFLLVSTKKGNLHILGEMENKREIEKFFRDKNIFIASIFACKQHGFAIGRNGGVYGFGSNVDGCCGSESFSKILVERVKIPDGKEVREISGGNYFSMFLFTDGSVYSCGRSTSGRLGLGDSIDRAKLTKIREFDKERVFIKSLSSGVYHTLFLTIEGLVYATGGGQCGELGNGSTNNSRIPIKINFLRGIKIKKVKATYGTSCFMDYNHNFYFCGDNRLRCFYFLFDEMKYERHCKLILTPIKYTNPNYLDYFGGNYSNLFVTKNGEVFGCGNNKYNCLGLDNQEPTFHTYCETTKRVRIPLMSVNEEKVLDISKKSKTFFDTVILTND